LYMLFGGESSQRSALRFADADDYEYMIIVPVKGDGPIYGVYDDRSMFKIEHGVVCLACASLHGDATFTKGRKVTWTDGEYGDGQTEIDKWLSKGQPIKPKVAKSADVRRKKKTTA